MLDKRSFLGNLFKTAFSLVSCVIDTTNKVKDGVIEGTKDAVDTVKKLQDDLKPMLNALNEVDPNDDPEPSDSASEEPSSTQSESSSSSSCTLQTVSNCNIGCTAIATTTLGGLNKRAEDDSCTTLCEAPITRCGATGVTSVTTVTSTTTSYRLCAPDCADCNANSRIIPTHTPNLSIHSKASNGVLYLPAPTVTKLDDENPVAEATGLMPKETGSPSNNLLRRGLTNPKDGDYKGDVGLWLRDQISFSPNALLHGQGGAITTGFSFPLLDMPDTWNVVNLYGCTSVIVISRKRMFMTHIWEEPSMKTPQNLQTEVLDSLRNGATGVPQGLTAFTGAGGDFEDIPANKVRAFIITPYRRKAGDNLQYDDLEYGYEVGKIKDLLKDVLGRSDTIHIPYVARGPDPYFEYPYGKVLIQYDPLAAQLTQGDNSCDTQVAGIELWFEDNPMYRYRDRWTAFTNQVPSGNSLPIRSKLGNGKERRLLRGREVTDAEEKEWKEYESLMKRDEVGSCPLPSKSVSLSTASPPSSTGQNPTTFRTSLIVSSNGGSVTSSDEPPSSTDESPSSTQEQPSETSTTSEEPTPTPNKAVSIIMKRVIDDLGPEYNSWTFFETSVGSQADGCQEPVLDDEATRWENRDDFSHPPWPHGTFTMTLFAEDNCVYLNDVNGAGILHCPSMGDGNNVGCKEDSEKSDDSAYKMCSTSPTWVWWYHRVVYCEYWDTW